jgi:hypothetical protein
MFGSNLELAAYVVAAELFEKIILCQQQVIEPYSGSDKDFLYSGYISELSQKV